MMIDVKKELEPTITLIMGEKEARWLMEMVQNPMCESPDLSSEEIRQSYWDALKAAGIDPR